MMRYNPPYNGKRYVLDRNTHEIHDLVRESSSCRINNILAEHVYNSNSYSDAQVYSLLKDRCPGTYCAFCMPEKNND